jgi:hypothetical protein
VGELEAAATCLGKKSYEEEKAMTKAKRMLSLLLAVIMILSVIPITAGAVEHDSDPSDGPSTGVNGLYMNKTVNSAHNELTLEAFVTGRSQTQVTTVPVDTALVLDESGSMSDKIEVAYGYDNLDKLDTVYGGAEGIYTAKFKGYALGFTYTRDLRYDSAAGQWQYYKETSIGGPAGWTVIGTNKFEMQSVKITKLNAMKIATKHFIDSANANSDPANPNRISIISYDSNSTIVKQLTSASAADELKAAIDALSADGATRADLGLQNAQTVLANTDSSRKKVAILFTDGSPTSTNGFEEAVANSAIATAKALKDQNTTIYTVGCFGSKPEDTSDQGKFMNYVSSNYPDATSLTSGGAMVGDGKYYSVATTSSELTDIFQTISQETGGATYTLTSSAVVQDVISEYFDLPAGTTKDDIQVYTQAFTGTNADGSRTWGGRTAYNATVELDVAAKKLRVSNFDFSENWVGFHINADGDRTPHGCKLVIVIPIKPIMDNCWGTDLPTNKADESGIYVGENPVAPFPVPTVDYPYYEIVHVRMGADGKPFYIGDQSDEVIADPTAVNAANRVRITDNTATVDLTTKVPNGYLYGGSFSNKECTTAWNYGTESAKSFHPQSGATYYIWEAPDVYLVPKSLSLSKTIDGQPNVIGFYLLTGVDRLFYQSAGFDVTDGDGKAISITDVGESGSTALNGGSGKVYQSLTTVYTNGTSDTYMPGDGVFKPLSASSYLACFSVPSDAWAAKDKKVVFTPYWITLDGMKVTGTTTRTCQSDGPGNRVVKKIAEAESGSTIMPANTAVQMLLTACGNVAVDGSENAPSASVDPIDPVVPIDPIDPVTPVDPVEPAKQFSVTVYDGGSVYTLSAEAGEDISSRLVSAGMHGMRFAGWFLDERSTAAAELKNVQGDMDVYAKYVSDTYLTLRYRNVGLFRSRNVKLYAALDSTDYAEAGFVIDGKAVSCPITKDAYTAFFLYGSTVREDNTLVSYTYGTSDLRYGDTVEITPYWVTLDGTTVYGTTQTLTYGRFGLM